MELLYQIMSVVVFAVTVAFLGWLYSYTKLKPVLWSLLWRLLNMIVDKLHPWSHLAVIDGNFSAFLVWACLSGLVATALFVWMLLALVRWGRPDLTLSWKFAPRSPSV